MGKKDCCEKTVFLRGLPGFAIMVEHRSSNNSLYDNFRCPHPGFSTGPIVNEPGGDYYLQRNLQ
jgi:hypothetical protein